MLGVLIETPFICQFGMCCVLLVFGTVGFQFTYHLFTAIVYEILYENVFGFDHEQVIDTIDNVRKKRYNGNLQAGIRYQPTSSSSSDERPSPTGSPVKVSVHVAHR